MQLIVVMIAQLCQDSSESTSLIAGKLICNKTVISIYVFLFLFFRIEFKIIYLDSVVNLASHVNATFKNWKTRNSGDRFEMQVRMTSFDI